MKLLIVILAFFVFGLSTIPCTDGISEDDNITLTENHSDHSQDDCTPFCTCTCCGIAIPFKVMVFEDEDLNIKIISHHFNLNDLYTQGFITSVWQPPAVS